MSKLHFFVSKRTGKLPVYCTRLVLNVQITSILPVKEVNKWTEKVWSRHENCNTVSFSLHSSLVHRQLWRRL